MNRTGRFCRYVMAIEGRFPFPLTWFKRLRRAGRSGTPNRNGRAPGPGAGPYGWAGATIQVSI